MNLRGKMLIGSAMNILVGVDWVRQSFGLLEVFSMCSHRDGCEVILNDFRLPFLIDEVVTPSQDQSILIGVVLERSDMYEPTDHGISVLDARIDFFNELPVARGFEDQFLPYL